MSYITLLKIRLLKKRTFLTKKQQKVLDFFLFLLARKCDLGQGFGIGLIFDRFDIVPSIWLIFIAGLGFDLTVDFILLRLRLALMLWFHPKGDCGKF
ncbi:hypothetical protein P9109_12140, partial [Gallibacterium anatis]